MCGACSKRRRERKAHRKAPFSRITADATPVTATSSTVKFTNLKLGYYLVVSSGWDNDVTVVCSLDTTDPDVDIEEKNGKPTIEKKIVENGTTTSSNTAGIGDYVQFQITVNAIDGQPSNYVVHDKMSTGLTFVNNTERPVTVKVGSRDLTATEYSFETPTDDCTFELKINDGIPSANDKITVTYYGQVNSSALINGDNTNEAKLTYGTNGESSWEQTTTKVFGFNVHKYDGADTSKSLLAGAQFRLYKTVDETTFYAKFSDGLLTGWTSTESEATILTSNDKTELVLNGLDAGTYYLEETQAPDGYNKLTDPVKVTITNEGVVESATNGAIFVANNAGATLPSTGGIGTTIFYVIGGGLMVAAVVLLVTKKRMENK